MGNPLYHKLLIDLEVDAKIGKTWYESKWDSLSNLFKKKEAFIKLYEDHALKSPS